MFYFSFIHTNFSIAVVVVVVIAFSTRAGWWFAVVWRIFHSKNLQPRNPFLLEYCHFSFRNTFRPFDQLETVSLKWVRNHTSCLRMIVKHFKFRSICHLFHLQMRITQSNPIKFYRINNIILKSVFYFLHWSDVTFDRFKLILCSSVSSSIPEEKTESKIEIT